MNYFWTSYKKFFSALSKRRFSGVSLVELLISVGMLGGVALTVSELMRQSGQVTSKTRTRFDESEYLMQLHNKLTQPSICEKNFPLGTAAEKASFTDDSILDLDDSILARVGDVYGEGQDLTIASLSSTYTAGTSWINVNIGFNKAKTESLSPQVITRSIRIFAEVDGGNVTRCLGSSLSVESSTWDLACDSNRFGVSGRDVMLEMADPADATQTLCVKKSLNVEGCGILSTEVANSFSYNNVTKLYDFECVDALSSALCSPNFLMKYGSDGSGFCDKVSQLQTYQPFNNTDNAGAFVSGPAVMDCDGRFYSGLQETDSGIRVMCDTIVADTPTPTATPTATNTPTATPTGGLEIVMCSSYPSTHQYNISKAEVPLNTETHYSIRLVNDCSGAPLPMASTPTGCYENPVGSSGGVCGVFVENTGGAAGTYTIRSNNNLATYYAGSTVHPKCELAYPLAGADFTGITIEVELVAGGGITCSIAVQDNTLGVDNGPLWEIGNLPGLPASPAVYNCVDFNTCTQ